MKIMKIWQIVKGSCLKNRETLFIFNVYVDSILP